MSPAERRLQQDYVTPPTPLAALQSIPRPASGSCVTIGVFDGVHRGHQALIDRCQREAAARALASVVVTFHPHPQTVLRPDSGLAYISALPERLRRIDARGVTHTIVLPFTHELSQVSADDFVAALVGDLGMRGLVVGPDFALGRGRAGTVEALRGWGERNGFQVLTVEPVIEGQERISSTAVRGAIAQGDMRRAATLLGRLFDVEGRVFQGDQRGRDLGFPTANVETEPGLMLPANGIYACWVWRGDRRLPAVTNVGVRPTFGDGNQRWVEAHLLDFNDDLYGEEIRVEFLEMLRPEQRFESAAALVEQMHRDVAQTRAVLASSGATP